ncbi:MAG: CocE/NonD family hydrolase [Fuerstiella sp.]
MRTLTATLKRMRAMPTVVALVTVLLFCAPCIAQQKRDVSIAMSDGVKLTAVVHLPEGSGPWPVILVRSTYSHVFLSPLWGNAGARRGYAVVLQHTRGRFQSEGAKLAFEADGWTDGLTDGADTVEWIQRQPWSNGKLGTLGGSALGISQYLLAGTGVRPLDCQQIRFATPAIYPGIYWGGVFRKAMIEDWLKGNKYSPDALKLWTSHPTYDDYWKSRNLLERPESANAAAVHYAGWYDIFAQQTIDAFNAYQSSGGPKARGMQRIIIGPWTHGAPNKTGELTFPNAVNPPTKLHSMPCWEWFDFHLKGTQNGIMDGPPVTYYVMGDVEDAAAPGNVWRTAESWPPFEAQSYQLHLHADGLLSPNVANVAGRGSYRYDPADPTPTIGGPQLTIPSGPRDQRTIEHRGKVFSTQPLNVPLEVTGHVRVRLHVSSDCPDTDFIARLSDVYPDGRSFNVTEGALRVRFRESLERETLMKPGEVYEIEIDLFSTSMIFNKGHRIRLHVTSSSDRGYDPNPNTGAPLRSSDEVRIATNTIQMSATFPSRLILPVPRPPEGVDP